MMTLLLLFCRYFIVLQIRKDLFTGLLPASFHTLAILGSYTVQSELGDFEKNQHYGIEYLRPYSFAPYTSEELLMRIADLHKAHRYALTSALIIVATPSTTLSLPVFMADGKDDI